MTPYESCKRLFDAYPLAVMNVTRDGSVREMVLMTAGPCPQFFILSTPGRGRRAVLHPWKSGADVEIDSDGTLSDPQADISVLTAGFPLPRDGTLLGWAAGGRITALLMVATIGERLPEPAWSLMLPVDADEAPPPFAGQRYIGAYIWEDIAAGRLVPLASPIAATSGAVLWAPLDPADGHGSGCVIAPAAVTLGGVVLCRGRYAFGLDPVRRAGVPSLESLLADRGTMDLAPRFSDSDWEG